MKIDLKSIVLGAGIAAALLYIFDEELQPLVDKSKSMMGSMMKKETKEAEVAGMNNEGDVLVGGNRIYQVPVNSGGTDIPVVTPLASPVSGIGQYVGQTAYPMGGAENNLESLINGASWMNAAAYTNASFGQNYSGRGIGNE